MTEANDDTAAHPDGAPADGASAARASGVNAEEKPAYPAPAALPTQVDDASGVRFDFNMGARVLLPPLETDQWHIRLRDLDTGNILFESTNKGALVASSKHFHVRFAIDLWRIDEAGKATVVLEHEYDCRDKPVLIQFPVGTLGDILGWVPYAAAFAELHGAKVTCSMSELLIPLFRDAYPKMNFVTHEELVAQGLIETTYATYYMGLFFDDVDNIWQPTDFRHVGLHRTAGYILGVDPTAVQR